MLQRLLKPAALAVVLSLSAHTAWAERKALVIGNAHYTDKPLTNPVNDAEDMAGKLGVLGFTVTMVKDANKRQFINRLEAFRASLNPDDDAVIYYAGHGGQFRGFNYLEPLNAAINHNEDLETEAVELKRVLNALGPVQNGLKLVIIDACRNNPFPGSDRSGTSGLAEVGVNNIPNQPLLWFAASPGEEARDGSGRNSPFTEQLLNNLDKPGLKAEDVFKQVTRAVIAATQNTDKKQHPYPEGQTLVDFYFAAAPKEPPPIPPKEPPPIPPIVMPPTPKPLPIKPKSTQRKVPLTEAAVKLGIEMVEIPGGKFTMGCGSTEKKCQDQDTPQREVTVARFALSKIEFTQGQWQAVTSSSPSGFKECGNHCPVENVSWDEVQAFIVKLNALTGENFRLPSEAEWQYACRAGLNTRFCGGDSLDTVAWHSGNSSKITHEVATTKTSNAFGLYDMSGNVEEWIQDCWHGNYQEAPLDGQAWEEQGVECLSRGMRGGSYSIDMDATVRDNANKSQDYNFVGFRLAKSLKP